jgi:hypothetical protein
LVEPPHKANLQLNPSLLHCPIDVLAFRHRDGHGLLQKHVFSILCGQAGNITMQEGGSDDHHGLKIRPFQSRVEICKKRSDTQFLADFLECGYAGVTQSHQFRFLQVPGNVPRMNQSGPAGPNDAESHSFTPWYLLVCRMRSGFPVLFG